MKDFIAAVRASGLVGLGGASFPTHIKLNPKNLDEVDTLIVNGAECEPFITSDHRLMLEDTRSISSKVSVAIMKYLGLKKAHIGVEENKPDAIEKLRKTNRRHGSLRGYRSERSTEQDTRRAQNESWSMRSRARR